MSSGYNWILWVFENDIDGRLRPVEIKNWITLFETVVCMRTDLSQDTLKSKFQRAILQLIAEKLVIKSKTAHGNVYSLTELGKEEVRSRIREITPSLKHSDFVGTYKLGDKWEQFRKRMIVHLENMYEPQMQEMFQTFDNMYRNSLAYKKDLAQKQSAASQ